MISNEIKMIPAREPPRMNLGVFGWVKENLLSSPVNAVATFIVLYTLFSVIPPFVQWAFLDATWSGANSDACVSDGACWAFVNSRLSQFTYGFYPEDQQWRADLFFVQLAVVIAWLTIKAIPGKKWALGYGLVFFALCFLVPAFGWFCRAGKCRNTQVGWFDANPAVSALWYDCFPAFRSLAGSGSPF